MIILCGLVGFVNYKKDTSKYKNVLRDMTESITRRGPDEYGYYISKNVALGHRRLIVIDPEKRKTAHDSKILIRRIRNSL